MSKNLIVATLTLLLVFSPTTRVMALSSEYEDDHELEIESRDREEFRERVVVRANLGVLQKLGELHANALQKRLDFYYQRLSQIYSRLGTKINDMELENRGEQFTEAKAIYAKAGETLGAAKLAADEAILDFGSVEAVDLATERKQVLAARDKARKSIALFKESVTLMKDAVQAMKKIANPQVEEHI